ncbi:MAG TPA: dihydrofolate reductase family protein [Acidimicrobiales bacterium]|nr:dihydrofolate reductase family protein [Acidimicrobiales bacterium]
MRKLIVSNLISLDGYAAGPGGDLMALPFDTTFSDYNLELMQAADTLVSGATTYRGFLSYWPPVADDPAQPEVERAISRRHRELEHLVVSDSLSVDETGPWRDNTTIVRRDEARGAIAQAKKGEGGELVAFGSMTTWNDLLAARLVDELHVMVGAGVLVDGVPAFSVRPPGPMRLTGARQLGASNIALLLYSLG